MKRIAIFCVSYQSDKERDYYLKSIEVASKKATGKAYVDVFLANNTKEDNPGYFGAVERLMNQMDITSYDYVIISNVDLKVEEDFFSKLAEYNCSEDTGWIAPQIWSDLEERDRNPKVLCRYSLRKLKILRTFYRIPILDSLYTRTFYRQKKIREPSCWANLCRSRFIHYSYTSVFQPLQKNTLSCIPLLRRALFG